MFTENGTPMENCDAHAFAVGGAYVVTDGEKCVHVKWHYLAISVPPAYV